MNTDRITGAGKELKGEVKKQTGDLTGNQELKDEGRADKAEGKMDKVVGKVKDILRGDK
ncbi:CsbD family protein [Azospirillum brasilense]|uniref:CsbD family protein n=1 Tax=Azospirillum brasilense TaxID=192 RepID=A0A4D8QI87_AZOBR|nr:MULTISPECIES: CsbD family protein [Azospirillum]MDW7556797.1 CsbD family protein [Azospirillum brasilense]MDW7596566.1 CsbD family protein [Azospirillum brasilense]MDW7631447.1 CsbD family protein [Azospirillum brasilense]MDX5954169.1 CsbD family protein [Azospirillum brasilense]NUB26444.1 CsbD family protein [Azospirillum brasilense]